MSELQANAVSFLERFAAGQVAAAAIDDFIDEWRESGAGEQRSLPAYLGFTDAEFAVWLMDRTLLPGIAAAHCSASGLETLVVERVERLRGVKEASGRLALPTLTRWLQDRGVSV